MSKFIPLSVPNLKGNELKYVTEAIEKEWVSTGGAYIDRFEKEIAQYLNVEQAVACQSGTSAIHLSLVESKIGQDDEVIVPTLTFIAAVNPVKYCNANPIFMDCDDTLTLDMNKLKMFCENECEFDGTVLINKKSKRKIKAVIVVHVFGNMADMEMLMNISEKYNLIVIEDATEALGTYYTEGKYKGKFAGTIGDFGCYSFNGNKIITTGGGGMIVAKDNMKLKHIKYLSTQSKNDPLNYVHNEIGYNYRMTNLQAAVGVAQLEQLNKFIECKEENFKLYTKLFQENGLEMLGFNKGIHPNYWFYSFILDIHKMNRDEFIHKLSEKGIQARPIWGLIHEQKMYKMNYSYNIEKAKYYYERIVNIPCSTNILKDDILRVVRTIEQILK